MIGNNKKPSDESSLFQPQHKASFSFKGVFRHFIVTIFALILPPLFVSCSSDTDERNLQPTMPTAAQIVAPETQAVATVNGKQVSLEHFNKLYGNSLSKWRDRHPGIEIRPAMALSIKRSIAESLINEQLVEQAAQERKITVTDADIHVARKELADSFPDQENLQRYVANFPNGERGVREMLRTRLLKDRLAGIDPNETISKDEARAYYERHLRRFNVPAHLIVQDIVLLVKPDAAAEVDAAQRAKAEVILAQAQQPDIQFAALARKHSEGRSASSGGWLRRVTADNIQPTLWKTLAALKPNQVSGIVRDQDGYHILRLLRRNPESRHSFEQVEVKIKSTIQFRRRSAKIAQMISSLRKQAETENLLVRRYPYSKRTVTPIQQQTQSGVESRNSNTSPKSDTVKRGHAIDGFKIR